MINVDDSAILSIRQYWTTYCIPKWELQGNIYIYRKGNSVNIAFPPFWKESTLKGKNKLPGFVGERKVLLFGVYLFSEGPLCAKANRNVQKMSPSRK